MYECFLFGGNICFLRFLFNTSDNLNYMREGKFLTRTTKVSWGFEPEITGLQVKTLFH